MGIYTFDKDGVASFVIDPEKCGEGLHRISVFFHRPGSDYKENRLELSESRSFRIFHTAADSGKFRFWGTSARNDRTVGEWADFTLKYDGKVSENCQFNVTVDDTQVPPLRQGGDKITDFFDKDGYCVFYLDVNGLSDGNHTVKATLTKDDGSTVTASNTVQVTHGYFDYSIGKYVSKGENLDLVYSSDPKIVSASFIRLEMTNTSGQPTDRCRLTYFEDDLLLCDSMLTENYSQVYTEGDKFISEITTPSINFGDHIMKAVFIAADGTMVEKNLPFRVQAFPRFYDKLHFSVTNLNGLRNVGKLSDFMLNYDTPFPACKGLSITLDGMPADIQIPDKPGSAFDHFGRFFFTLSFTDQQLGEHIIEATLTKEDGAVMKAKMKFCVTDDYFELTNWPTDSPDTPPVMHRVYDVKVKKRTDTGDTSCSVRQYIDGEDMGAAFFDENGLTTLGLNTAGLESGEHWYKVVFSTSEGTAVERLMRFLVE